MNFASLDGFRGLAAFFVLLSHGGVTGCRNLGMIGVVMFFCLSGFLLTLPFAKYPESVLEYRNFRNYYARRFKRIVPMFYFYLLTVYFFEAKVPDFIRSALFLQGKGVLWTIIEEMHFYVFLPIVFLVGYHILRRNYFLLVGCLMIVGYSFNHGWLPTYRIYGVDGRLPIFAGLFLTGVIVCYLYHLEKIKNLKFLEKICSNHIFSLLIVALFITTIDEGQLLGVVPLLGSGSFYMGDYNYFIGFVLLVIILGRGSVVARFLASIPLRLLGTISYSFYLLHPMCLEIVKKNFHMVGSQPYEIALRVISAFIITFCLSILTYTYIERPFIKQ
jgi:peptidoglycan/LPS O-acetylase OafA/YrhL